MTQQVTKSGIPVQEDWMGQIPIVGLKIVKDFDRPSQETIDTFREFFVPDVAGCVGPMYTMSHTIRPAYLPINKMVGPATTVKVQPGDNALVKRAFYMAQPGDVIVIDARGHMEWCLGGSDMILVAKSRGVAGVVVDGAYRDISVVQEYDFPLFIKGVSPATGPKVGPGEVNTTVCCGGVIVNPGDIVVGDVEGLAVVPRDSADKVIAGVRLAHEKTLEEILQEDVGRHEAYDALFEAHNIVIVDKG
jgi:regulator of RNase E activity RraA